MSAEDPTAAIGHVTLRASDVARSAAFFERRESARLEYVEGWKRLDLAGKSLPRASSYPCPRLGLRAEGMDLRDLRLDEPIVNVASTVGVAALRTMR